MALSGQLSTDNQYIKYTIEIIQNSQNIGNNTSNVTVKVRFFRTNTGYETYGSGTVYCKIDGTTYSASVTSSQKITNSGIILFNKTLNITHGSNGAKSLGCSAWIKHNKVNSNEQSFSMNLTTIPRTSSFTLSQSAVNLGSTEQVVTISRASSSFTHRVTYKIGSHSWEAQASSGTATTVKFTPPKSDCSYIPNATSATATVVVDTYNGGTLIGSTNKTFVANVPGDVVPTFTELKQTIIDAGAPTNLGYVQGHSKVKLDIVGATGVYSSTIKSYSISGGGNTGTGASLTTAILSAPGSIQFQGFVTDSRGRKSAIRTITITVQEYSIPKINSLKVERTDASGKPTNEGEFITITPNYSHSTLGEKNSLIKYMGLKATSETDYAEIEPVPASGEVATFGGISTSSSYMVKLMLEDLIAAPIEVTASIGSAFVTMDFKAGGRGIAIGKVSEVEDLFEVAMDTNFLGKLTLNGAAIGGSIASQRLAQGTDLNNIKTEGMYYSPTNADVATMLNVPSNQAFSLLVEKHAGCKQTFTVYSTTDKRTWIRNFYSDKWSGWTQVITMDEVAYSTSTYKENRVAYISSDGVVELGRYLDLHMKGSTADFDARIECLGGNVVAINRIKCPNWYYSTGSTGWYNETHDGGWLMQDSTWIRSYKDKGVYTGGIIQSGSNVKTTGSGKLFRMGNGDSNCYMHNEKHTGYLQFRDDGMFGFANGPLWSYQAVIGKAEWGEISIFPSGDNRGNLGTNNNTWNTLKSTNQYSINSLSSEKASNITPYSDKEYLYNIFKDVNLYMLNNCSTTFDEQLLDEEGVPYTVKLETPEREVLNEIKLTVNAEEMPMLVAPKNIDGDSGNVSIELGAMISGLSGAFSFACEKIETQEQKIIELSDKINQMEELLNGFISK